MPLSEAERVVAQKVYLAELIEAGLLIPLGVPGVYGRSGTFERVVQAFERFITREGADQEAEVMHFPPVLGRADYARTDHFETMPQLLGSLHSFEGSHAELAARAERLRAGEDWASDLTPTAVVMVPAACYPLYPVCAGTLPGGGRTVDLVSFVFRHEPSDDPARMQSFRQREYVRLGSAHQAREHRDRWLAQARSMLGRVGLDAEPVLANDPFFGRGGRVMKATQREQELKYEIVVPIASAEHPTAVVSCNCHLDHFGIAFGIRTADGEVAHTACVGFGLERIALALFRKHGLDPDEWPEAVRRVLEWG